MKKANYIILLLVLCTFFFLSCTGNRGSEQIGAWVGSWILIDSSNEMDCNYVEVGEKTMKMYFYSKTIEYRDSSGWIVKDTLPHWKTRRVCHYVYDEEEKVLQINTGIAYYYYVEWKNPNSAICTPCLEDMGYRFEAFRTTPKESIEDYEKYINAN